MIDIHSHLVYDVDDGSKNIEETICMLKEAYSVGFTDIIVTPHYMVDYYIKEKGEIENKINIIRNKLDGININICHGNEIYVNSNLMNFIKEGKAVSLAGSKYILFELPMQSIPINLDEVVYLILENGYVPIIAHPERYKYVQENPNMLVDYIEKGILFQANYGSIIGVYGNKIKETVQKLLTHNMIHFLGSDNHRPNTIYRAMPEIIKNVNKLIGEDKQNELTTINPMNILENKDIDVEEPETIKKSLFKFWK